ncbi:ABC transporter permease [Clostridium oryzae]|uniref:Transport permease protein n=1 Tax=Clostridium oryzae TaxID=1450648 RepID=A0A1V4IMX5_9CLOT|nr:ABC transporter permease [Clostridium oryzae]OPJ61402.1 ABC-2 type transporter [Clostridium oryzae]
MYFRRNLIAAKARFLVSMKLYFRYPLKMLQVIVDPLIWLTPFYFMSKTFASGSSLQGFQQYSGSSDYMGFLIIGYMITGYVNTAFWSMGFSLKEEMWQGVLESNWSAPVNRINLLISKSLFSFIACTVENIITGIVCYFAFGFTINGRILTFLAYLLPGVVGMLGLGIMICALVLLAKEANAVIDISSSLISGLSGGFFPIKAMPRLFLMLALALPVTYLNDASRAILIGQTSILSLTLEFIIILASMFGFMVAGSFVFNLVERRSRAMGNLSGH